MWGPLFKNCQGFQDRDGRALNQAQGPSEQGALWGCVGHMPLMLALPLPLVENRQSLGALDTGDFTHPPGSFPRVITKCS